LTTRTTRRRARPLDAVSPSLRCPGVPNQNETTRRDRETTARPAPLKALCR
jgi:hypothetical protein